MDDVADAIGERPDDPKVREGSYFIGKATALMQVVDGVAVPVEVTKGRSTNGIFAKHALIIRKLIPIRDAVRLILKLQESDQPWQKAQVALRIAWSSFVREFGPINFTSVSTSEDPETGEVREVHRRPNIAPFLDDPDCWLMASIEDYDLETNTAKPGPIFTERVIAPPPAPVITSASDALAVVLNERGHVDPDHIAELLHRDVEDVIGELGEAVFRDPTMAPGRCQMPICPVRFGRSSQSPALPRTSTPPFNAMLRRWSASSPPISGPPILPHASAPLGSRR